MRTLQEREKMRKKISAHANPTQKKNKNWGTLSTCRASHWQFLFPKLLVTILA